MSSIPYTLTTSDDGWQVHARGFTWYFESRQKAIAFALATARDFTMATGQATSVRLQGDDGGMRELREFNTTPRLVDPLLAMLRANWR